MALKCEICDRGTTTAFNVSHSKRRTKKIVKINLQTKRVNGQKKRICTKCIKTLNKSE